MRSRPRFASVVVAIACFVLEAVALPAVSPADDSRDNVIESFRVARNGDVLVVPVEVAGKQFQFCVDTGTTGTVVDPTVAKLLTTTGATMRFNGKDGHLVYKMEDAFTGKARLPITGKALSSDFSRLREACGYNIHGVLGMSFLRDYIVRIDFDRGGLFILRTVPESAGECFRMSYDRLQRPTINIGITPRHTVPFMIDTGLCDVDAIAVAPEIFESLVAERRLTNNGSKFRIVTFEGERTGRRGELARLRLRDFEHPARVAERKENTIGLGFLYRYVVTFDFPQDELYLSPSAHYRDSSRRDVSGLMVLRSDGKTLIYDVESGSAAEVAGLRRGDRIVALNREDVSATTLFELRCMLATEGLQIRLGIERPSGRSEVDLRLPAGNALSAPRGAP